ncbi:hypothetical protein ACIRG5_25960 [Lentzea sp. NPDC102401]|uniref:hypothetical protein n=1 Tax=Lentzea sp. NPDC102401 TaxID=3364128 RepID=UPI00382F434C
MLGDGLAQVVEDERAVGDRALVHGGDSGQAGHEGDDVTAGVSGRQPSRLDTGRDHLVQQGEGVARPLAPGEQVDTAVRPDAEQDRIGEARVRTGPDEVGDRDRPSGGAPGRPAPS